MVLDCWQTVPHDRPTFSELYKQIDEIIERNYANIKLNKTETVNESYLLLQQDWRQEIQSIFEELKNKEQVKQGRKKSNEF